MWSRRQFRIGIFLRCSGASAMFRGCSGRVDGQTLTGHEERSSYGVCSHGAGVRRRSVGVVRAVIPGCTGIIHKEVSSNFNRCARRNSSPPRTGRSRRHSRIGNRRPAAETHRSGQPCVVGAEDEPSVGAVVCRKPSSIAQVVSL